MSLPFLFCVLLPCITTSLKVCGVQISCVPGGYFIKAYNITPLATINVCCLLLIAVVAQSKARTVFCCLVARVMGLNCAWNVDVYMCFSAFVLSCVVSGLRQTDSSSRDLYRMSVN